jgi:hypothetical protein
VTGTETSEEPKAGLRGRHRAAMNELVRLHGDDPSRKLALVICGSLATGKVREGSDLDLYLVLSDEEFERVRSGDGCFYGSWDGDRFSGVEIDGKIVGKGFLVEAAERGSEPTRASFEGAYCLFSHDPDIDGLIERIAAYPESEREAKIRTFYAFVKHHRYLAEEGFRLGNDYLFRRAVTELVFFSSRLGLAHNRVLYPCHKSLLAALEKCPDLPPRFVGSSEELLASPSLAGMLDYYDKVASYFDRYDYPDQERISLILENEWSWFSGLPFAGEW